MPDNVWNQNLKLIVLKYCVRKVKHVFLCSVLIKLLIVTSVIRGSVYSVELQLGMDGLFFAFMSTKIPFGWNSSPCTRFTFVEGQLVVLWKRQAFRYLTRGNIKLSLFTEDIQLTVLLFTIAHYEIWYQRPGSQQSLQIWKLRARKGIFMLRTCSFISHGNGYNMFRSAAWTNVNDIQALHHISLIARTKQPFFFRWQGIQPLNHGP